MFGKFNIADALRQYGINPCTIVEGRNADAQFPFSDWNKEQLKQVNHLVDHIYTGFVQKVVHQHPCCLDAIAHTLFVALGYASYMQLRVLMVCRV